MHARTRLPALFARMHKSTRRIFGRRAHVFYIYNELLIPTPRAHSLTHTYRVVFGRKQYVWRASTRRRARARKLRLLFPLPKLRRVRLTTAMTTHAKHARHQLSDRLMCALAVWRSSTAKIIIYILFVLEGERVGGGDERLCNYRTCVYLCVGSNRYTFEVVVVSANYNPQLLLRDCETRF